MLMPDLRLAISSPSDALLVLAHDVELRSPCPPPPAASRLHLLLRHLERSLPYPRLTGPKETLSSRPRRRRTRRRRHGAPPSRVPERDPPTGGPPPARWPAFARPGLHTGIPRGRPGRIVIKLRRSKKKKQQPLSQSVCGWRVDTWNTKSILIVRPTSL